MPVHISNLTAKPHTIRHALHSNHSFNFPYIGNIGSGSKELQSETSAFPTKQVKNFNEVQLAFRGSIASNETDAARCHDA